MEPRISEYGLAQVESQDQSFLAHIDSFQENNSPGGITPNNAFKEDTYSFGVILLELMTGKLVQNNGFDLARWVNSAIREEWTVEVFDKALVAEGASEERMVHLLQVALKCINTSSEARPSIREVAGMINSIKENEEKSINASGSHTFQRQLQQLFLLHDSGLDQALIDALPVFYYKEIMGLKEPFDCAVCLCEFSDGDKLKLLPNCGHAFHIHCIETWLLSNSTCPLCRSLIGSGTPIGNPLFNFNDSMEQWNLSYPQRENESFSSHRPEILQENACLAPARIFSVRLGKFRSSKEGLESEDKNQNVGSSSSLDARRCYSMGALQYIVGDADLQVTLSSGNADSMKAKARHRNELLAKNAEIDGKKINLRSRSDSFSVSKIWLWSKKGKFLNSSDANDCVVLPIPARSNLV
ncbi:hypothetical protein Pfo_020724 [Paulownia fortunei]|nr:hypothetical protein Pfo_020724 [Paulownia fortunei]